VNWVFPPSFYHSMPVLCQGFTAAQSRRKSNGIVSFMESGRWSDHSREFTGQRFLRVA